MNTLHLYLTPYFFVAFHVFLVVAGISTLIVVHEFGHFLVARLCGVRCEKFYIGFDFWGLSLVKFRWGETEFGLGVFPFGGYVKMLGQEDDPSRMAQEKNPASTSFASQSVERRASIVVAGIVMNLIFAVFCASTAYMIGLPDSGGEKIVRITNPGEAVLLSVSKTAEFSQSICGCLGGLLTGSVSPKALGGPVMIVQMAYQFASQGLGTYLMFLCMISVNLAIFNLLPIPILDGGHLIFLLYERVFREPPHETIMVVSCYVGLIFLLGLTLWTVSLDLGLCLNS